jgi:hypothetical protein
MTGSVDPVHMTTDLRYTAHRILPGVIFNTSLWPTDHSLPRPYPRSRGLKIVEAKSSTRRNSKDSGK